MGDRSGMLLRLGALLIYERALKRNNVPLWNVTDNPQPDNGQLSTVNRSTLRKEMLLFCQHSVTFIYMNRIEPNSAITSVGYNR
ncbi:MULTISPECIES: hypothetical protein [unclassified Microcoleus]|uniref:hypothetical protein n=1 Tax=unclassified Microcoleus TaxID=2642155 RepID=UPI0025D26E15|nr:MULTISPECIES: hypothetical protein [unclassified Microcoleus]